MCGIAGFTHLHSRPNPEILLAARESIRLRGPDQQGSYTGAAASLAAVRLKILDLGGGDQPIYSPDRDTVIVFNGEIYNFRALRAELESHGHRFESDCDTEVVLKGFLQWDTDVFARLHGMFAVALWTESSRRLVLARDRMGIKPLYLARRGADLHFGSELKAILAHPEIKREADPAALSYFLSLNYVPHPHTMIAGIRKLEPGSWLEWVNGRERSERYWRISFRPNAGMKFDDAKQELDFLLDRAVREHLVSDVPLGIWLSGGLDSSAITHYAAKHFPGRLKTFSVSFQGRSFDESPYFREVARAYATDHVEFDLSPDLDLAGAIERIAHFADEPSADAGALPVWFLSKMTREHVTVALSGEGADELFGGYKTYQADAYARWLRLFPAPLRRLALAGAGLLPVSDDKISFEYKVKRFLEGSLLPADEAHLFWNGVCSRTQKQALLGVAKPMELFGNLPASGLNRYLALDQRLYLVEDILYKCDRMSMAHSLEVRPPFLDHRIAEFAATLPESFKAGKLVLRELMRDKLPRTVTKRSKEGFDIPTHDWFRNRLKPLLLDTVTERAMRESGLMLDWPAVRQLMDDHFARRINAGYHLWGLLTFISLVEEMGTRLGDDRRPFSNRYYELIVVLVAALIFGVGAGSPPSLMDDVDAVQAQIARNMLDSGDWVTARLDGVAYLEKAPLKYWMMAASMAVFGIHDWAARIPLVLSTIALCWLAVRMGTWAYSPREGFVAGLVLATCVGLWLFTRILIPDVVLTLTIALALYAFLRGWAYSFWACLGVGFLLKGLIAMVFPVGAVLLFWGFSGEWREWRKLKPFTGVLLTMAIAAPWVVLATLRNPPYFDFTMHSTAGEYHGFFWFFFLNEHVFRFLNMRHPRDYNTVPRVAFWLFHFLWLFPWSVWLPSAIRRPKDRMSLLCLCWIGFLLVFFTFSTTQEYYSMPCYPALALLLGRTTETKWPGRVLRLLCGLVAVLLFTMFILARGYPTPGDISQALTLNPDAYTLSLGHMSDLTLPAMAYLRTPLLIAAVAFGIGAAIRQRAIAIPVMMVLFTFAARQALIVFDPYLSSRPLAEALLRAPKGEVIFDNQYYTFSSVFFYANTRGWLLNGRVNNLEYGSYAPGAPQVFINDAEFAERWRRSELHYLLVEGPSVPRIEGLVGKAAMHVVKASGGKFLFANRLVQ